MNWLYEVPWYMPAGLCAVGVILLLSGNSRQDKRLWSAGLLGVVLALVLALASYLLESDREQVVRRTYELVKAVEKRDGAAMRSYLHPEVRIVLLEGPEMVVQTATVGAEAAELQSLRITGLKAGEIEGALAVSMRVFAQFKDGAGLSDWELEWEKPQEDWLLREARPQSAPGTPQAVIEQHLRPRR